VRASIVDKGWIWPATIAQRQGSADRGWDGSTRAPDVENLAGLADAHVDPHGIASQHSGDVQRQRRAVAQEP